MREAIIYKDDHLIIINKPAGLPSQGGSKQSIHVDGLGDAISFEKKERPRLVHRLDKDTSGVMVLARTRQAAKAYLKPLNTERLENILGGNCRGSSTRSWYNQLWLGKKIRSWETGGRRKNAMHSSRCSFFN